MVQFLGLSTADDGEEFDGDWKSGSHICYPTIGNLLCMKRIRKTVAFGFQQEIAFQLEGYFQIFIHGFSGD